MLCINRQYSGSVRETLWGKRGNSGVDNAGKQNSVLANSTSWLVRESQLLRAENTMATAT